MAALLAPRLRGDALVFDPAAGSGRLLAAALGESRGSIRLRGVELQPALASLANQQLGPGAVSVGDGLGLLEAAARRRLLGVESVDCVIANPPYVREKSNRAAFEAVRADPAWDRWVRPRQDLQQLFLHLALDVLRPGGQLVFLTTNYWLTTDAAQPLRSRIHSAYNVLRMVDFGGLTLFPAAPGHHSLLIHLERDGKRPGRPGRYQTIRQSPGLDGMSCALLAESDRDPHWDVEDRRGAIRRSGATSRWYFPGPHDAELARLEAGALRLGAVFQTHQGIVSGADRVSRRNAQHIEDPPPFGAGIFLLSGAERDRLSLNDAEQGLVRQVLRGGEIAPFTASPGDTYVLMLDRETTLRGRPQLLRHLNRFRPLLERRREVRLGLIPWFQLHWPRATGLFDRPRIVTPRRAPSPRFAMAPSGSCEQSDVAMITDPADDRDMLRALLTVLNSPTVARWCAARGRHKGPIREYFGSALEDIPIPHTASDDPARFKRLGVFAEEGPSDRAWTAVDAQFAVD